MKPIKTRQHEDNKNGVGAVTRKTKRMKSNSQQEDNKNKVRTVDRKTTGMKSEQSVGKQQE